LIAAAIFLLSAVMFSAGPVMGATTYETDIDAPLSLAGELSVAKIIPPAAVFTVGLAEFEISGVKNTMDVAPYIKDGRVFLPLRYFSRAVGVPDDNIIWNQDDQSVEIKKDGTVVKLVIGSDVMTVGSAQVRMDTKPEIIAPGRTMLPLRWAAEALGSDVSWDEKTRQVKVFTVLAGSVPALSAAEDEAILSLEEAIILAQKHNSDLKLQQLNLDVTNEQLDDLRDSIEHVPATNVYVPGISAVYSGYLSAETGERIAKKALENMRQQLVVSVMEQYYNILSSKRDLIQAETDLRVARIKLAQARLKKQIGMSTQAELLGIETEMQGAVASLTAAQNALDQGYTQLAVLIGTSDVTRPKLIDEAVFEKAEFTSLEAVTASALSRNYTIWAAERLAALADRVDMYADNYNIGMITADIKAAEASDAREQLTEQVKVLYQALQTLEETNATLEQKAATLEETYRVARLMHEVGMATPLQELEAEQAYNAALAELRQMVYEYDLAKSQLLVVTGADIIPEDITL